MSESTAVSRHGNKIELEHSNEREVAERERSGERQSQKEVRLLSGYLALVLRSHVLQAGIHRIDLQLVMKVD